MEQIKISIGRFAKGQSKKQMSIFALKYKNEIAKVYSIKIPFNRFVCVTIKKKTKKMNEEKQVYLVTYNACYDGPDNATTEGCILATDYEDANEKFLKWLDKRNAERFHAGESEEDEDEFDLDEINILDYD